MNKVYCPWCGHVMELEHFGDNEDEAFSFVCHNCAAESPISYSAETALATALARQAQNPLTLEELIGSVGIPVWFESHGTYMGKKGWWMIPQKIIKMSGLSIHGAIYVPADPAEDKNLLIRFVCEPSSQSSELGLDAYGSVWRAWKAKPANAEMEAAKWDD